MTPQGRPRPGDPVEVVRTLARSSPRVFWLDGGGSRPWSGRRSIVGVLGEDDVSLEYHAATRTVLRHRGGSATAVGDDIFAVLAEEIARDRGDPAVSWVGYLGYAARPDLPALLPGSTGASAAPDAVWMRVRDPWVFQHPPLSRAPDLPASPGGTGTAPPMYAAAFAEVQRQLRAGNTYEVNLTYRVAETSTADPLATYLRLRRANPAPYAGYLRHHGTHLLSSSPERYATVDRHRWVETKPMKGTTPRGTTAAEDAELAALLAADPRFRAENLMVVDLLRNDLSMVCRPGSVSVPSLMAVESYPSVHQLVSTVRGRLRDEVGTVEALRALFPAGSMTGAPKRRTMEVIAAVEDTPRGVYSGAFGWICADGRADLGVVIRSLIATPAGMAAPGTGESGTGESGAPWRYEIGTGGGITVRSDLAAEFDETLWKYARLHAALADPA